MNTDAPKQPGTKSYTYEFAHNALMSKLSLVEFTLNRLIDLSSRKIAKKWSTEKSMKMMRRLERTQAEKNKIEDMFIELDKKFSETNKQG